MLFNTARTGKLMFSQGRLRTAVGENEILHKIHRVNACVKCIMDKIVEPGVLATSTALHSVLEEGASCDREVGD